MSDHEDLKEIKRLKAELSREFDFKVEYICRKALSSLKWYLIPENEICELTEDESEKYFVFEFWKRYFDDPIKVVEKLSVSKVMIYDGIMTEKEIKAALWQTLGKTRGMV